MPEVPLKRPLPGPLAGRRARKIRRAWPTAGRRGAEVPTVDGFDLMLAPGVVPPLPVFGYSPASTLGRALDARAGERVLDLSASGGLVGLHAAKKGASVAAADPDPNVLLAARRSFLLAGFGEPELREGQGLSAFAGEQFAAIAWTPPWLAGTPAGAAEERLMLAERAAVAEVLATAATMLGRGGRVLFPFPDRDAHGWLPDLLQAGGWRFAPLVLERYSVIGPVRVWRAWRAGDAPAGRVASGEPLAGAAWVLRDR